MTGPGPKGRVAIRFREPHTVGAFGLVALEDYARELTRARAAEAVVAPGEGERLVGLELEAPVIAPQGSVLDDIEAFARELAERAGDGLGWS
jgi:hypothetical protein